MHVRLLVERTGSSHDFPGRIIRSFTPEFLSRVRLSPHPAQESGHFSPVCGCSAVFPRYSRNPRYTRSPLSRMNFPCGGKPGSLPCNRPTAPHLLPAGKRRSSSGSFLPMLITSCFSRNTFPSSGPPSAIAAGIFPSTSFDRVPSLHQGDARAHCRRPVPACWRRARGS